MTAKAGKSNTQAAAQDAASSIQDQVAGIPAAAQAALLLGLTMALSNSVATDKGGKCQKMYVQLIQERTLVLSTQDLHSI
jgi:hypothetical protein